MRTPTTKSVRAVAGFAPRKLRPFLELATLRGVAVEPLLAAHGTSLAAIEDPETRLPRIACIAIMKQVFGALNDPQVGLQAAQCFVLADMDLLGFMAEQQSTVLAALEAVVGYASLIGDASRARLLREPGRVILEQWIEGSPPQLPELADYQIASSHRGVCLLAGKNIAPLRVELARPRPRAAGAYRAFFGAPVTFDAARGRLVYPQGPLQLPRVHGNARLGQLLAEQAEARRARLGPPHDLLERAGQLLLAQLEAGAPSSHALARSLWMSERSLRRRLEEAGKTYRSLLDAVRRDRALALLAQRDLGVAELARRLGFTDPSAFARAFRRWTGSTPSSYRRSGNSCAPQAPDAAAYKPPSSAG